MALENKKERSSIILLYLLFIVKFNCGTFLIGQCHMADLIGRKKSLSLLRVTITLSVRSFMAQRECQKINGDH